MWLYSDFLEKTKNTRIQIKLNADEIEKINKLQELQTSDAGESPCVLYLGNAEQARKTLRANNPESARKYRYDSDEPIGEMIFQGKRIYADIGCTHSGILHI